MKRNASAPTKADTPPPLRGKEAMMQVAVKNAIDLLESLGYKVFEPQADSRRKPVDYPVRGRSYTISEVALAWHVCYRTVYRAVTSGKLLAVKIGNVYRIPEEAMLMYERWGK